MRTVTKHNDEKTAKPRWLQLDFCEYAPAWIRAYSSALRPAGQGANGPLTVSNKYRSDEASKSKERI